MFSLSEYYRKRLLEHDRVVESIINFSNNKNRKRKRKYDEIEDKNQSKDYLNTNTNYKTK